jgi:uncharacterized protein (DUF302 family)
MQDFSYGFETLLADTSVDDAAAKVTEALAAEGFGVLTRIDIKETLHKKLGVDVDPYVILGACNPKLAHRALQAEPQIGLMLPCNVVVKAEGSGARVSFADPKAMFQMVDRPELAPIAEEAEGRLRRAAAALG